MAGISSKAMGRIANRFKFNKGSELQEKEFADGSGLDLYATNYRNIDPQIGRFLQIDPMSTLAFGYSPYAYASNNPLLFNDPFGLISTPENPEVLPEVTVTPNNNRNKTFSWFGWTSSTNFNRGRSQNIYDQRRDQGLNPAQPKDKSWYLKDLKQYDMEGMYVRGTNARRFERMFYLTYFSALSLPFLSPGVLTAAPELVTAKAVVSATAQGMVNGPRNINVLGVAADAFLPFSSAAVINGVACYQPFAESEQFRFIGYNKSLEQATTDFGVSFAVGGLGAKLGEGLPAVNGAFQKNVVEVSMGTPTSFAQEIANTLISQKTATQK